MTTGRVVSLPFSAGTRRERNEHVQASRSNPAYARAAGSLRFLLGRYRQPEHIPRLAACTVGRNRAKPGREGSRCSRMERRRRRDRRGMGRGRVPHHPGRPLHDHPRVTSPDLHPTLAAPRILRCPRRQRHEADRTGRERGRRLRSDHHRPAVAHRQARIATHSSGAGRASARSAFNDSQAPG
jgi:hypothetical protein